MAEAEKEALRDFEETLTSEELVVLRKMLHRLEWQLFQAVVARLKVAAFVVAGFFTVFGLASIVNVRNAVVETASSRLAGDSDIQDRIVTEYNIKTEAAHEILRKSAELERDIDEERVRLKKIVNEEEAHATVLVNSDLQKLLHMVRQIGDELTHSSKVTYAKP